MLFVGVGGLYKSYTQDQAVAEAAWGAVVFVSFVVLLRRAWLWLFGPILFYDLVRLARRNRYFLIRVLYLGVVSVLLLWQYQDTIASIPSRLWLPRSMGTPGALVVLPLTMHDQAMFAEQFFNKFMVFEFAIVMLLMPVYTAGAIAEEKDRKTLEFLLATDLGNREIILSKFLSRLANLAMIVMIGFPIVSVLQFLGGVDPDLLLASFAALVLTMASLAGLSIFFSVRSRKPRDAILLTYLVMAGYVGLGILGEAVVSSPSIATSPVAVECRAIADAYNAGNVPVVLYKLQESVNTSVASVAFNPSGNVIAVNVGRQIRLWSVNGAPLGTVAGITPGAALSSIVPKFLRDYAIFHALLILATLGWAVYRVQRVVLGHVSGVPKREPPAKRDYLRPAVSDLPMIWKELFIEPLFRLRRLGQVIIWLLIVLSFIPAIWYILQDFDPVHRSPYWRQAQTEVLGQHLNAWVRIVGTAVASLLLLGVAVRASTAVGGERDRDTLDALLVSPLQSNDILLGKWLGSVMSVRWGWLWLGAIWAVALVTGGMHHATIMLSMVTWLVFASVLAGLGLWFSTACKTTLRATMYTLAITGFLGAGQWALWMCCLPFSPAGMRFLGSSGYFYYSSFDGPLALLQVGFSVLSPPTVLYQLSATQYEMKDSYWEFQTITTYFGLFMWVMAGVCIWSVTRRRFRKMTARMPYHRPEPALGEHRWKDPWNYSDVAERAEQA
jgi:ABC-type transport system involved in multi-copper enzyme maturation permease subunit